MSDKKLYWQSAAHMQPENFIRLVVSHTQHDRLYSGIISKDEPRQKEYFSRDTLVKEFY